MKKPTDEERVGAVTVAKGEKPPRGVWYRNSKGRLCLDGQCFSLEQGDADDFDLRFDEACDIPDANEGKTALEKAALGGKLFSSKRRAAR